MIHAGLVSVSFRKLQPKEIVALARRSGLTGIEWGGDIHVPHGEVHTAQRVRRLTEEAGLEVAAYGSYYRTGVHDGATFESIVETARSLGAPVIRVWAGDKGSAGADESYREQVAADSQRIATLAAQAGIAVAYEWHGGTLTDTKESAAALLAAVKHANVRCYWQPVRDLSVQDNLAGLDVALPRLRNVHVFHWLPGGERRPLAEGEAAWMQYLRKIAAAAGDRYAMLEFVKDDSAEQCVQDAKTLNWWLSLLSR